MELYFLRHGLAGQHGDPKYKDDSLRPLTNQGCEKMQRAACGMQALELNFDAILSSPYLRARQTAEIVAEAYKTNKKEIYLTDNLLPPAPIEKLLREIQASFPEANHVLLVGHEPHLTQLVSQLLKSKPLSIDFKKGGLCCLSVENSSDGLVAVLNWLLTPSQLNLMSKEK